MADVDVDRMRQVAQRALADGAWWDRREVREALDQIADIGDDTAADAWHIWEARPVKILALLDRLELAERRADENGYRALGQDRYLELLERSNPSPAVRAVIDQIRAEHPTVTGDPA